MRVNVNVRYVVGALLMCGVWSWASAQIPPGAAGNPSDADDGTLEEVVVTAERRTEDIQKIATPITAVSGAEIAAKGETEVDQVLRDTPSVQIQSAPSGSDIVIRGVGGNDVGGITADPAVSTFIDGVYNGQPTATLGTLYDVQRVEVLRGPQGTLYGRNSSGGAVNILTNDPTNAFGAGVTLGYGNYDERHGDGFVNIPLGDTLAFRLAAVREERDGYYSNGAGNIDNTGARAKLKWTPSEGVTVVVRADYWRSQPITSTAPTDNGPCPVSPVVCFTSANPRNPWETATPSGSLFEVLPVASDDSFYTYSAQADIDVGIGTLTLVPAFERSTEYANNEGLFAPGTVPVVPDYTLTTNNQYTYEARLASPNASRIKWVVGAYYLMDHADQTGAPGGSTVTFYAQQSSNRRPATSYAEFAQATLPVTDQFRVTLGGRYTVDSKGIFYGVCSSSNGLTCGPSETGAGTYTSPAANLSATYSRFTYKAGVEYDVTSTAMAYAQVSTGYKAGGWSTAGTPPVAYQPETLTNFEVGIKSRLLNDTLQLNGDVYLYQYHNQQLELHPLLPYTTILPAQYIPATYLPGGSADAANPLTELIDVNAGNSRYEGAETQAVYQLTRNDQITAQAAYNHAVYGHLVINTTGGPPGTSYASPLFDLSGKQEAHAPLWNGSLGYRHQWDVGAGNIALQATSRIQSGSYTTIQEWFANGNTWQGGYHQTDADLRYTAPNQTWNVGVWVQNLENKAVVNYVYPLYRQTLDIGRTYGVNASYKF